MGRAWLSIGSSVVFAFSACGLSWAQQSPDKAALQREATVIGEALSLCLSTQIRRLAKGKTPTQVHGDAAVSICASEEEAVRKVFLKALSLENGVVKSGPYAGINVDLIVLCTRQHMVWGLVGFDERLRRDESVPLYRVDPRCR